MRQDRKVVGIHSVAQLINEQPEKILSVYWDANRKDARIQAIIQSAQSRNIKIHTTTQEKLTDLIGNDNHQGIVAYRVQVATYSEKSILNLVENNPKALIVILDCVQDPHNLGACMRSALALGAMALVFPQDKSCGVTPIVSKVASGAAELLPFVAVKNLARFMQALKKVGLWCVGTSLQADKPLHEIDLRGPVALVMGGEATGLRSLTEKNCDYLAKIPLIGPMGSLNVSVATGISLYEVCRQRAS